MALDDYKIHPAADCFPMLDEVHLAELADDIRSTGLQHPIVVWAEYNVVVDGRNRLAACQRAGIEPTWDFRSFADDAAVVRYVIAANVHRRHLSGPQRAAAAAKLATLQAGDNQHSVRSGQLAGPDLEVVIEGRSGQLAGPDSGLSQAEAADLMGVSERSVRRAVQVRNAAPDLLDEMIAGTMSAHEATRLAQLPEEDRRQLAAMPKPERRAALRERDGKGDAKGAPAHDAPTVPAPSKPAPPPVDPVENARKGLMALADKLEDMRQDAEGYLAAITAGSKAHNAARDRVSRFGDAAFALREAAAETLAQPSLRARSPRASRPPRASSLSLSDQEEQDQDLLREGESRGARARGAHEADPEVVPVPSDEPTLPERHPDLDAATNAWGCIGAGLSLNPVIDRTLNELLTEHGRDLVMRAIEDIGAEGRRHPKVTWLRDRIEALRAGGDGRPGGGARRGRPHVNAMLSHEEWAKLPGGVIDLKTGRPVG